MMNMPYNYVLKFLRVSPESLRTDTYLRNPARFRTSDYEYTLS